MKTIVTILVTALVVAGVFYVIGNEQQKTPIVGAGNYSYGSFNGITSATTSVITVATSTPIYAGIGFYQSNVEICNTTANPIDLYLVSSSTATTTNMLVGKGTLLEPFGLTTSTINYCRTFVNFNGDIRAIGSVTSTVRVNYSR